MVADAGTGSSKLATEALEFLCTVALYSAARSLASTTGPRVMVAAVSVVRAATPTIEPFRPTTAATGVEAVPSVLATELAAPDCSEPGDTDAGVGTIVLTDSVLARDVGNADGEFVEAALQMPLAWRKDSHHVSVEAWSYSGNVR